MNSVHNLDNWGGGGGGGEEEGRLGAPIQIFNQSLYSLPIAQNTKMFQSNTLIFFSRGVSNISSDVMK